jgi:hypothetical protein
MAFAAFKRSDWILAQTHPRPQCGVGVHERVAKGMPVAPGVHERSPWFSMAPSGEHAVRDGKNEPFVIRAECARAQIPDAPLP